MASMSSVTTRGFGLSGGFAGTAALVVTLGYGLGAEVEVAYGRSCSVQAFSQQAPVAFARQAIATASRPSVPAIEECDC